MTVGWVCATFTPMTKIETGTDELLATVEEGVVVLALNRPESRNALSDSLSPALRRAFAELAQTETARCVVLTGTGTAFCAGGDIKGMGDAQDTRTDRPKTRQGLIDDLTQRQQTLTGALYALPNPPSLRFLGPPPVQGFQLPWPAISESLRGAPS